MRKLLVFEEKMNFLMKKKSFSVHVKSITFDGKSPDLSAFTWQKLYHFETKYAHFLSKTIQNSSFLMLFRSKSRFLSLNP